MFKFFSSVLAVSTVFMFPVFFLAGSWFPFLFHTSLISWFVVAAMYGVTYRQVTDSGVCSQHQTHIRQYLAAARIEAHGSDFSGLSASVNYFLTTGVMALVYFAVLMVIAAAMRDAVLSQGPVAYPVVDVLLWILLLIVVLGNRHAYRSLLKVAYHRDRIIKLITI